MADLSLTHQLLADIDRKIVEEEADVKYRIDRLRQSDYEGFKSAADEEWQRFLQRVKPLLDERGHLVKQLATIEACKHPAAIQGMKLVYAGEPGESMAILPNDRGVLVVHPERQPKIVRYDGVAEPLALVDDKPVSLE